MAQAEEVACDTNITAEDDLHCHLLPAWDDGPRNLEISLQLARKAEQLGVKKILVTPHVGRSFGNATERAARDIPAATADLEREIKSAGIAIDLVPGAEVVLSIADLPSRAVDEPWLTVGGQGRYILVESPFESWPQNANQIIFDLSLRGITAIIAHPERLTNVQDDMSIVESLVQRGALLQITARSIVGPDRKNKQCAQRMLKAGLVSLIASDAHSARHVFPAEVQTTICALVGQDAAKRILTDNARAVLAGNPVTPISLPTSPLRSGKRAKLNLVNWILSRRKT